MTRDADCEAIECNQPGTEEQTMWGKVVGHFCPDHAHTPKGLSRSWVVPGHFYGRHQDVPDGWEYRLNALVRWNVKGADYPAFSLAANNVLECRPPQRWMADGNGLFYGAGRISSAGPAIMLCFGESKYEFAATVAKVLNEKGIKPPS